jgi:hypothetical protein
MGIKMNLKKTRTVRVLSFVALVVYVILVVNKSIHDPKTAAIMLGGSALLFGLLWLVNWDLKSGDSKNSANTLKPGGSGTEPRR